MAKPSVPLSVRHVTNTHIVKFFPPSDRSMTLVFRVLPPLQNSYGNPSVGGGVKYSEVGKFGDFRPKSTYISETLRDRPFVTVDR